MSDARAGLTMRRVTLWLAWGWFVTIAAGVLWLIGLAILTNWPVSGYLVGVLGFVLITILALARMEQDDE